MPDLPQHVRREIDPYQNAEAKHHRNMDPARHPEMRLQRLDQTAAEPDPEETAEEIRGRHVEEEAEPAAGIGDDEGDDHLTAFRYPLRQAG